MSFGWNSVASSRVTQIAASCVVALAILWGIYANLPPSWVDMLRAPFMDVTPLAELPALVQDAGGPQKWDLIEGLKAERVHGDRIIANQPVLKLIARSTEGRHALSAHFEHLAVNSTYRLTTWIKAGTVTRIMLEARDSVDRSTGKPAHYGWALFDVGSRKTIKLFGDVREPGIKEAERGWLQVGVNISNRDGQLYVLLALLKDEDNSHIFRGNGQTLTFGGFNESPVQ
jgi:hypothetical protein